MAAMARPSSFLGPSELDVASKVIVRAQFLLNACGAMSDPPMPSLDRLAEIIVGQMADGCCDEDDLVKAAVDKYLTRNE